jgi:hypothetical protein
MPPTFFKSDESFQNKLRHGRTGALATIETLNRHGHDFREFERGALSSRIWRDIKRKQFRLPDLICIRCGQSCEVRTKALPELSMSHSESNAERAWDYNCRNDDWIAFPVVDPGSYQLRVPVIPVSTIGEFRRTQSKVKESARKSAEEGAELRLVWKVSVAKVAGRINAVDRGNIRITPDDGKGIRRVGNRVLEPWVVVGDHVVPGQIVASLVKPVKRLSCQRELKMKDTRALVSSRHVRDRYAGWRIVRLRSLEGLDSDALSVIRDEHEELLPRIEAATYLGQRGKKDSFDFFSSTLTSGHAPEQLEVLLCLREISDSRATRILREIMLDDRRATELRAASAWCLGQHPGADTREALLSALLSDVPDVLRDVAFALSRDPELGQPDILQRLASLRGQQMPGWSLALLKSGQANLNVLLQALSQGFSPLWAAFVLGRMERELNEEEYRKLESKYPQVAFAARSLRETLNSWVLPYSDPKYQYDWE